MSLAREVANRNVTVNTVSPGYIETDMLAGLRPDVLDRILDCIPVRRLGKPEEIASIVAWLASDEAGLATAAGFPRNGRMHIFCKYPCAAFSLLYAVPRGFLPRRVAPLRLTDTTRRR